MPPKGKGGDKGGAAKGKGKAKPADDTEEKVSKVKGAQYVNVRHILCEKHGKKEEALEKLKAGGKFDEVAKEFSEDKARVGTSCGWSWWREVLNWRRCMLKDQCRWSSGLEEAW